jgi:dephospho-CoA kinase
MLKRWRDLLTGTTSPVTGRIIIAITGGIGSGKSTVGRTLAEAGVLVIDTDDLAHELTAGPSPAYDAILQRFGADVASSPGGPIDRKRLGGKVFADDKALADLEGILHPAILTLVKTRANQALAGQDVAVLVPLLFEKNWHLVEEGGRRFFNECWCIVVTRARQIEFLCTRNGISQQEAETLIDKQWSTERKAKLSTRVIDNNGTLPETRAHALSCLAQARKDCGRS